MTNTDKPTDIEIDHHAGTVPYDILSALQEIDESAHPDNALTLGDWGLLEQNPNLHLYVAKQRLVLHNEPADEIVGFCVAQIFGATEIERLVVTPERRREGIGTRLMRCVLDEAARQGAQRATTVIRSNDEIAHKFCEHFRFNAMGTRKVDDAIYFVMDRISEHAVKVR
jgi:ribosomal protein S18 acetylase RimI-like enzyme